MGKKNNNNLSCYEILFFSGPSPKQNLEILSTPQRYFPLCRLYRLSALHYRLSVLHIQALGRRSIITSNKFLELISRTFGVVEEMIFKILFLKLLLEW